LAVKLQPKHAIANCCCRLANTTEDLAIPFLSLFVHRNSRLKHGGGCERCPYDDDLLNSIFEGTALPAGIAESAY